jgi:RNA polymerase sigma factor for flagellar operon FliA
MAPELAMRRARARGVAPNVRARQVRRGVGTSCSFLYLERTRFDANAPGVVACQPRSEHDEMTSKSHTELGMADRSAAEPVTFVRPASVKNGNGRATSARARARAKARAAMEPVIDLVWDAYRRFPSDEHRNILVEVYRPVVTDIVRRFASRLPRRVDRGDLGTAAHVGLMSAIGGFDPARGVRFESYCERRIRGALLDELRTQDWLPRPWRQRIERHKRVIEQLRSETGREPCDDEIAHEMGIPVGDYQQVFGVGMPGAPAGSMSNAGENADDSVGGLDVVADTRNAPPGDKLTREELLRLVAQKLTEQEYRIVYLKYWEELPMREIGDLAGLSESRVCKIHAKLLERLKDRFWRDS